MKQLFFYCAIFISTCLTQQTFAQNTVTLEDVEITEVIATSGRLTAEKDGDEFEFAFQPDIKVKNKKGKQLDASILQDGLHVDITYELTDSINLIRKIALREADEQAGGDCNGFFDYLYADTAFIGGKRVILKPGVIIKGADDKICRCKGYSFKNFQQKPLAFGYRMVVKGKQGADGILVAEKVTACKNSMSEAVGNAIAAVADKFEGGKLVYKKLLGFYKGSLSAGGVEYKLHKNEWLQEYIVSTGNKIVPPYLQTDEAAGIDEFKYRFLVIDNEMPEAFSWPNGMVFINTGLLKTFTSEAQLAFVLSRELAHINYYHTAERVQKMGQVNKVMNVIKTVITKTPELIDKYKSDGDSTVTKNDIEKLLNKYADMADKVLSSGKNRQLLAILLSVKDKIRPVELIGQYTKAQEREADEVALGYMFMAGYDVREAVKFWNTQLETVRKPGFAASFTGSIKKLILADGLFGSLTGDLKTALIGKTAERIIEKMFESSFNTPKLTRKRLEKVKTLIQQNYPVSNFSILQKGEDKYKRVKDILH